MENLNKLTLVYPYYNNRKMKTLAILITAYKAEKYILETLNAFKQQKIPKNWNIKYFIGVDGCNTTANLLKENNISYYFAEGNVGTYILTNSLIKEALKDNVNAFLRFDSDDVPCENFLMHGIYHLQSADFVRPYKINCDENLIIKTGIKPADGPAFFTRYAIDLLGGYDHYRVACDGFFRRRAETLNLIKDTAKNIPTYFYRNIHTSLTKSKGTGKHSKYRKNVKKLMLKSFRQNILKIENPITTFLEYVKK